MRIAALCAALLAGCATMPAAPSDPFLMESRARVDGTAYTRLAWVPDKRNGVTSFTLDPVQPGDAAINAVLRSYIPGQGSGPTLYEECREWAETGFSYEQEVAPETIAEAYVGVLSSGSNYCGGAHPNTFVRRSVYDRTTGMELDPSTFLKADALVFYDFPPEEGEVKRPVDGLGASFRSVARRYVPRAEGDCGGIDILEDGSLDIGVTRQGIVFEPELAHAVQACADTVTVPWVAAAPYLSAEGRAVRAALGG